MTATGTEIERKFLIESVLDSVDASSATRVRQGYLAACPEAEARIRDADGAFTLTVKSGSGLQRKETEIFLEQAQFELLWPATETRRIEKTRLRVESTDGLVIEIDIYEGRLTGLIVAEVEFPSLAAAAAFDPPEWFGHDVTEDPRYKNAALATSGIPVSSHPTATEVTP